MTGETAREAGLYLYAFTTGRTALKWADAHRTFTLSGGQRVACVFEEEHAHFYVYWVAMRPCPPIKKFHTRIAYADN